MKNKLFLLIGLVSINQLHGMSIFESEELISNQNGQTFSDSSVMVSPRDTCPSPKRVSKLHKLLKRFENNPNKSSEHSKLLIQLERLQSESK